MYFERASRPVPVKDRTYDGFARIFADQKSHGAGDCPRTKEYFFNCESHHRFRTFCRLRHDDLLCAGAAEPLVRSGLCRIMHAGVRLRIFARRLAVRSGRSSVGLGGVAQVAAGPDRQRVYPAYRVKHIKGPQPAICRNIAGVYLFLGGLLVSVRPAASRSFLISSMRCAKSFSRPSCVGW
jgi:hypothetical protein